MLIAKTNQWLNCSLQLDSYSYINSFVMFSKNPHFTGEPPWNVSVTSERTCSSQSRRLAPRRRCLTSTWLSLYKVLPVCASLRKAKWRLSDGSLRRCCGLLWPRAGVSSLLLPTNTESSQVTTSLYFELWLVFNVICYYDKLLVFQRDLAELALAFSISG